jgi:hypothetical protein
MTIIYTNIFHCKTLQNLPKWEFLVLKYAIWQPWYRAGVFRYSHHARNLIFETLFFKATSLFLPLWDSISRPIAPISSVGSGDDTTRPRRHRPGHPSFLRNFAGKVSKNQLEVLNRVARFSRYNIPKREKCTKMPQNVPKGQKYTIWP